MNGFHIIYNSIHKFSYINDASFVSWLKRIMINECLIFLRKKNKFEFLQIEDDEILSVEPTVFDDIESRDLLKLIDEMPIGYKTILNLYVVEQMSHKEISDTLNISEGTSKSQLSRARVYLKSLILNRNNAKRKRI
jgi:RNA polymerase sigma-70 factor (ECF subfamily)